MKYNLTIVLDSKNELNELDLDSIASYIQENLTELNDCVGLGDCENFNPSITSIKVINPS
jgi:hypothetical protein